MNRIKYFLLTFFLVSCQQDVGKGMFQIGQELWEDQKYDDSIQHFIALTKAYSNHSLVDDSLFWIANIYDHYLNEPKQAVRYYRSLNKKFEESEYYIKSMTGLAKIYKNSVQEDKRRAFNIYKKLQRKFNKERKSEATSQVSWEENQISLLKILIKLKEYEGVRAESKALILNTNRSKFVAQGYYQIGYSYYLEGKLDLAAISFKEADKIFHYSKETLAAANSLADVHEDLGNLKEVIKVYESIVDRLEKGGFFFQVFKDRVRLLKSRMALVDK